MYFEHQLVIRVSQVKKNDRNGEETHESGDEFLDSHLTFADQKRLATSQVQSEMI